MDFKPTLNVDPAIWEHYYELAITTRNPEIRLQRIAEAQALILRRVETLEEGKATDAECQALEDAAEFLQHVESQLYDLRDLAAQRGFEIVKEYEDRGVSGSKARRPGLDALMLDARKRKFTVVSWRLSTGWREAPDIF